MTIKPRLKNVYAIGLITVTDFIILVLGIEPSTLDIWSATALNSPIKEMLH